MNNKAIDVSRWNGDVNYNGVKSAGINNVIIQCGYGMVHNQKDPYLDKNYTNAKTQKMKIGIYHYSYARTVAEAKKEAKLCLSWIRGKVIDLPVYIDMEEENLTYLGKATLTNIALAFCETISKAGYKAGVYANANWFRNHLDYKKIKSKYSIWLAQYADAKDFDCDIWQYASDGRLKGNACNFDMNIIYTKPQIKIKFKKNAGLYPLAYKDPVGGTSKKILTAKKNTTAEWLSDDGTGWSKVKVNGKTYYAVNSRIDRKGLSKYKTITLKKNTTAYKLSGNKLIKAKIFKKNKALTAICIIEKGKYKDYYIVSSAGNEYYLKK